MGKRVKKGVEAEKEGRETDRQTDRQTYDGSKCPVYITVNA